MIDNQEIQLESQISHYFTKDNGVSTHFRYNDTDDGKLELEVYTFNKKTGVNFLFHRLTTSSSITALSKMLKYIAEIMPTENNYTVIWEIKGKEGDPNESYFRGTDIEMVVSKFYEGKNREEIDVVEVKLNPIA